jgi:isoleucyl-tRNA synthetase
VRQPLSQLLFVSENGKYKEYVREMSHIISEELNVKEVELGDDSAKIVNLVAKPNFRILGAKAGKLMGRLSAAIKNFDANQIQSFMQNGYEHILIDGHEFRLEPEDIEISAEAKEGFVAQSDRAMTVALNIQMSDELLKEGFAREFVNRVQNFRKEAGFEVTDHIVIQVEDLAQKEEDALLSQKAYICNETLADDLQFGTISAENFKETKIDKLVLKIGLLKK